MGILYANQSSPANTPVSLGHVILYDSCQIVAAVTVTPDPAPSAQPHLRPVPSPLQPHRRLFYPRATTPTSPVTIAACSTFLLSLPPPTKLLHPY